MFIYSGCYLCWSDSHPSAVLCGSTVKTAALLDVETNKILYQCDTQELFPLNGLLFATSSSNFFTLSNNGNIELWDPRMKALAMHCGNNVIDLPVDYSGSINYAMDVCGGSYEDTRLTCVSRLEKQVVFYELRQWKVPLASIPMDHRPKISVNKQLCIKVMYCVQLYIVIIYCVFFQFSPHNDGLLSISGKHHTSCFKYRFYLHAYRIIKRSGGLQHGAAIKIRTGVHSFWPWGWNVGQFSFNPLVASDNVQTFSQHIIGWCFTCLAMEG